MSVRKITSIIYRITCDKTGATRDFVKLPVKCWVRSCARTSCIHGDNRRGPYERIRINPPEDDSCDS